MRQLATLALMALTILVSAIYLPMLYEKLFFQRVGKTHLLFSPVTQRFIYKEKIVGPVPEEALGKAEDHHAEIAYRDADGNYYSRVEFEKNLPFIYYKNMELWGLMPLQLGGQTFDKAAIRRNRQVLELRPGEIIDRRPHTPLWPLLESNPGQARLVFPEDRFRLTDEAMVFVNGDINRVDAKLTTAFTTTLTEQGFAFPARSVHGKSTILKPFDEGVFVVDAHWRVFHIKRIDGRPHAVRTPIDPALKTRHIKVSENRRREYYGFLLDGSGDLHLLTYDNYGLIRLPLEHYDPDVMDVKLLANPLYRTAVWSDERVVRAVAMDRDYQPIERYEHTMSRGTVTPAQRFHGAIFPFTLQLEAADNGYLRMDVRSGSHLALVGLLACLLLFALATRLRRGRFPRPVALGLVALTGIYGWIAMSFLGSDDLG